MASYYSRKKRVLEKEEQRIVKRIIVMIGIMAAVGGALLFWGVPLILKVGSVFDAFKPVDSQNLNQAVIAPRLEPVVSATNSATLAIEGFGQEGSTINLYVNDQAAGNQVIGNNGEFSFPHITLKDGQNTIYAKAKTDDGKESTASLSYTVVLDTIAPHLEVSSPSDRQEIKSLKDFRVVGKTEASAALTINDNLATVTSDGNFNTAITLPTGESKITIVASDAAGNQTTIEKTVIYNP